MNWGKEEKWELSLVFRNQNPKNYGGKLNKWGKNNDSLNQNI